MPRQRRSDTDAEAYPAWNSPLKPAPGELRIVQAFINTADRENGTDELAGPERLASWLKRWRLAPAEFQPIADDATRTVAMRQSLRVFIRAGHGATVSSQDLEPLNLAASLSPLFLRCHTDGTARFEPSVDGLGGAFGRLLDIVATALGDGRWPKLKICANPECRKVFYDYSPNGVGKWCVKNLCGSRINSRNFRRRHPGFYDYRSGSQRKPRS